MARGSADNGSPLAQALHLALRSHKQGRSQVVPRALSDLLVVRSLIWDGHSLAAAVEQVISDAMRRLRQQSPAHYDVLQRHYLQRQKIEQIARELSRSGSGIYGIQERAIDLLASLVQEAEDELARSLYRQARANLPQPTYTRLFGQAEAARTFDMYLREPQSCFLVAVDGMGGSGKTSLVRSVAERLIEERVFRRLVWVTVHERTYQWQRYSEPSAPALDYLAVADEIARRIGISSLASLPPDEREERLRHELGRFSTLVVVDNLETAEDIEAVVSGLDRLTRPAKVVLVSRQHVGAYDQVCSVSVGALNQRDGLDLVRYHAWERHARRVLDASEHERERIARVAGGNPLAIKLIIGQSLDEPLAECLAHLEKARPPAYDFYRFIFQRSWRLASEQARRILIHMPIMDRRGATWPHLAAVCRLSPDDGDARLALDELVGASLLNMGGRDDPLYSIHPLTEYFLSAGVWQSLGGEPLPSGSASWADVFASGVRSALRIWLRFWHDTPERQQRTPALGHALAALGWAVEVGAPPQLLADLIEAMETDVLYTTDWRRWETCVRGVRAASADALDARRRLLLDATLATVVYRLGRFDEAIDLGSQNLTAAQVEEDIELQASTHISLAEMHVAKEAYDQALVHCQQAVALADLGSDLVLQADARINLARACMGGGMLEEAERQARAGLALAQRSGRADYQGKGMLFLGHALRRQGKLDEALAHYNWALSTVSAAGDNNGRGVIMTSIAGVLAEQKRWREADDMLGEALALVRMHGNRPLMQRIEQEMAALRRSATL